MADPEDRTRSDDTYPSDHHNQPQADAILDYSDPHAIHATHDQSPADMCAAGDKIVKRRLREPEEPDRRAGIAEQRSDVAAGISPAAQLCTRAQAEFPTLQLLRTGTPDALAAAGHSAPADHQDVGPAAGDVGSTHQCTGHRLCAAARHDVLIALSPPQGAFLPGLPASQRTLPREQ